MSPENLQKIAHPEIEISNVNQILVRKKGNEQTDRHTKNLKLFGTRNITGMSPENLRKLAHSELEIYTVNHVSVRK